MPTWLHKVKLQHLFTQEEDHASIQASMNAIADVLKHDDFFFLFREVSKFRTIPTGDEVFGPVDYANKLMGKLYDFADEHRIWID